MELKEYLEIIKKFIKDYLDASHMDGYVLGLSGGIDSALVARLTMESVGKDKLFCLMLPCHSNEDDLNDAVQFAKKFDIRYEVVDLSKAFDEIYKSITAKHPLEGLSEHNIKVRLRMVTYTRSRNKESRLFSARIIGMKIMLVILQNTGMEHVICSQLCV